MVSPVWSPHTATVGHTCALAKQWRQTVRIETIAGQLSTPGRARRRPGREARTAEVNSATERNVRKQLAKGVGILKIAKSPASGQAQTARDLLSMLLCRQRWLDALWVRCCRRLPVRGSSPLKR
jgi:hypothetical protein